MSSAATRLAASAMPSTSRRPLLFAPPERQSGTVRLEKAVAAYGAALAFRQSSKVEDTGLPLGSSDALQ